MVGWWAGQLTSSPPPHALVCSAANPPCELPRVFRCAGRGGDTGASDSGRFGGARDDDGADWSGGIMAGEAPAVDPNTISCFVEVRFRGHARRTAAVDSELPIWNEQVGGRGRAAHVPCCCLLPA